VIVTVATGNFEKIAKKKLELAGIDHFFRWDIGGFGDVMDRTEVVRTGLVKCGQAGGLASVILTTDHRNTWFPEFAQVFPEFSIDPNFLRALGLSQ
jgi:hypothetical protein